MSQQSMTIDTIKEDDFIAFCISPKIGLGKGSLRNLRFDFRFFMAWVGGQPITKELLEQFFLEKSHLSHSYLNKFIHLNRYLDKYVKDRGIGDLSFVWEMKTFKIVRPPFEILNNEQIEALYHTRLPYGMFHGKDRNEELNFLHVTILMFLSQTGCRVGELQDLEVRDFDPIQGKVIYRETKNGTYRYNFIYDPLLSRVKKLCEGKKPGELIFTNAKGSRIVSQDYNQDLKKRCEQTGIIRKWEHITTHTFRHSLVVELLTQGVPMALVAAWVGHKDIESTNYYYKSLDEHLKQAISHHRIIRSNIAPGQLIEQLQEAFDNFRLSGDDRFGYKMEKGDNSFSLTIYIK